MCKPIWLIALVIVTVALAGCSIVAPQPALPTLTPVRLPPTAGPTEVAPRPAATSAPAAQPAAPIAASATATRAPISPTRPAPTAVPTRLLALGRRPALTLRVAPQTSAAVAANLSGSEVLWAEARSADNAWLRVAYGEAGGRAWAAAADVTVFGEVSALPSAAAAAAAPAPAPQPPAAASGATRSGRVSGGPLNVRAGPGVDQAVIGQATDGQALTVVGRSNAGDWLAVTWGERTGWVAARYVELAGAAADLPVLAAQTSAVPASAAPVPAGKVVFQTASGGDIYLVAADGSGLRRLTTGLDPALSPDGNRLAFARWDAPAGVFVLDLRTGAEQRVATANRPRGPAWSQDGSRLVFSHSTRSYTCRQTPLGCFDEAVIRDVFGGQECVDTPQGRFCISDFPLSSADDTGLVQISLVDGGWLDLAAGGAMQSPAWRSEAEILFRTGDGLQVVTPGSAPRPAAANPELGSPAPAPDGKAIAVHIYLHDHADIFLLDAGGAVQRRLTTPPPTYERRKAPNNVAPAWSPDGRTLLFLSDRDGAWRLYQMNIDGSGQAPFAPAALAALTFKYDFAAERVASWGR
jgi:uncharacterized protein YraI